MDGEARCPITGAQPGLESDRVGGAEGTRPWLEDWWPERLQVELLHDQSPRANPMGEAFDYPAAFASLDLEALKADIRALLTDSQDFWPADYGHYGPQMIRMAWHSAGTYRVQDGRGGSAEGMQRFLPIGSWVDNGNIDKSRRLLWPIKKKYGSKLSWADLIILTGNVALESMGFKTLGFGGGRIDAWEPDNATYWGPEFEMETQDKRWVGKPGTDSYDLENPLAASQSSLIYVNPQGPYGKPDVLGSAQEIRITFGRMGMNDEETVALIAGGHAFGKSHGATPKDYIGPAPAGSGIENQDLGWLNSKGTGNAEYTTTNGIEGSWTSEPTKWDIEYLRNLFAYEWELTESPAGSIQWKPKPGQDARTTRDAHIEGKENPLMMMTTDIALKEDPAYRKVCERFLDDPSKLDEAFAKAWYKLIHRDMGPKQRLIGADVPDEEFIWQDPIPALDHETVSDNDVASLKEKILATGLPLSALVSAAWASASTFRGTDYRGGANGARIRLCPMKDWEVNRPGELERVLDALETIQSAFNDSASGNKRISMADMIILAGCTAVEKAAKDAGVAADVPFVPGRMDATEDQTDPENMHYLKPFADGFRNYLGGKYEVSTERLLVDRADLLTLSAPEMTALVGGLRVLDTNYDGSDHGVFTDRKGTLTNDFFVNILDHNVKWSKTDDSEEFFEGKDRKSGEKRWNATRADLVFGASPQLRAVCEVYAADDGHEKFVHDFIAAWHKVMMLDRFELQNPLYRA
ncbi:catalase/peroxidase HPI [Parvularcula sp. ZS-1/3]|uniref:Catalase-peroxidase n=1 Tax=Parvularcula mediterranea TaxID=2732508 RepID=A0A7Y3RK58_9PROT|nr:catalase/peroxidase HPI [Parvularcula mediterranea]NNU15572.1 catalase/peroxidase HPI [Parvularcula mediterranea]